MFLTPKFTIFFASHGRSREKNHFEREVVAYNISQFTSMAEELLFNRLVLWSLLTLIQSNLGKDFLGLGLFR